MISDPPIYIFDDPLAIFETFPEAPRLPVACHHALLLLVLLPLLLAVAGFIVSRSRNRGNRRCSLG